MKDKQATQERIALLTEELKNEGRVCRNYSIMRFREYGDNSRTRKIYTGLSRTEAKLIVAKGDLQGKKYCFSADCSCAEHR